MMLLAIAVGSIFNNFMYGPQAALMAELFDTEFRYSGASLGYQIGAIFGGGFAPIIATALAAYMGGTAGVSVMLILLALLTLVATFFAHETKDQPLLK
jgi:MHS family shikimate/dehydroshikimate transporter-like MFS transporter